MIYAFVSLAVLIIAAFMMRSAHDRRLRRERLGLSQTEVIDALEGEERQVASTVVQVLTEEYRIRSPILLHDRLSKDLGLAGEDVDEFMEEISARCKRTLPENASFEIATVYDAIRFVAQLPSR